MEDLVNFTFGGRLIALRNMHWISRKSVAEVVYFYARYPAKALISCVLKNLISVNVSTLLLSLDASGTSLQLAWSVAEYAARIDVVITLTLNILISIIM